MNQAVEAPASRATEQDREDANLETPDAGNLNAAARRVAAERGWAMEDGSYPIRPADMHGAADLDKAVNAVGRGSGSHNAIRKHIIKRARAIGESEQIPDNWASDGSLSEERSEPPWTPFFTRTYPLDDIRIRSEGDGRTVEAYAAVFDEWAEVRDQDGHYQEAISRSAFNRTLSQNTRSIGVFYNHGMTIHGTPSDRGTVPIGTPMEMCPDGRGLLTVTRYHRTELADEVLEAIREGAITGQSFSGRFLRSDPPRVPRRKRGSTEELPQVTRTEIALREYGPTPFPAYEKAAVVGVRALLDQVHDLDERQRDELKRLLEGTSDQELAANAEDPHTHSDRPARTRAQVRARLFKMGVLLP